MFKKYIVKDKFLVRKAKESIATFLLDRGDESLKDHALQTKLTGFRSFSVTKDIRIVYQETEDHFIFHRIGTHEQVYPERKTFKRSVIL